MKTIFSNAIESISIGVIDAQSEELTRHLSAIRNVFAGILLLYKEKLVRLSPKGSDEILIKSKIVPALDSDGKITFIGKGKGTVNVHEIRDRFDALGIKTDWKRLDKMQKVRNNLEHYQLSEDPKILAEVLSDSLLIIRDFLVNELNEKPVDVFEEVVWNALLENNEVFERELQLSIDSLKNSGLDEAIKEYLEGMECYHCNSELVVISEDSFISDVQGKCRTCGGNIEGAVLLEKEIERATSFADYRSVKNGGETLFDYCPSCGHRTYSREDEKCLVCDYEIEYDSCELCGNSLSLDEQELGGYCFYCSNKIDELDEE